MSPKGLPPPNVPPLVVKSNVTVAALAVSAHAHTSPVSIFTAILRVDVGYRQFGTVLVAEA